jgi:hypothetical protein
MRTGWLTAPMNRMNELENEQWLTAPMNRLNELENEQRSE